MAGTELEKRKPTKASPHVVSPADEPSAEWGWHGTFPKGTAIAAVFTALSMFFMLTSNTVSGTEHWWLAGTGAVILVGLLWKMNKDRTSWRR
ncbi:DUF2631 domain-containing protein [Actinokineospora sp. G85]|uniref:DUF2631 domain-containing protein n=1 Tax=Actinokineospora sp. G85 TaxID=3406626 RepID=UPI003C74E6D2